MKELDFVSWDTTTLRHFADLVNSWSQIAHCKKLGLTDWVAIPQMRALKVFVYDEIDLKLPKNNRVWRQVEADIWQKIDVIQSNE